MKLQRRIGEFNVVAICAKDLEEQARGLLDKIAELNERGPAIQDGTTIKFGWSLLTLISDADELVVWEPDFEKDPHHDLVPQAEHTLRVLTEQMALLRSIGVEGTDADYLSQVVIAKGCLNADRIYLERTAVDAPKDSGWYIGEVESAEQEKVVEDLETMYVYQIFQTRRPLMPVLALPPGYLVVFHGEMIQAIFNDEGSNVLAI